MSPKRKGGENRLSNFAPYEFNRTEGKKMRNDKIANVIRFMLTERAPQLKDSVTVSFDRRLSHTYECYGSDALVRIRISVSPAEDHFDNVLKRCARSALIVRRNVSNAHRHRGERRA